MRSNPSPRQAGHAGALHRPVFGTASNPIRYGDCSMDRPAWITPTKAAELAGVTRQSVNHWCERYGIGRKVGGRWRVNSTALDHMLHGTPVLVGDDVPHA